MRNKYLTAAVATSDDIHVRDMMMVSVEMCSSINFQVYFSTYAKNKANNMNSAICKLKKTGILTG